MPPRAAPAARSSEPAALARRALLEGVGAEVADSFPGITRLGGQIVAALYLAEGACSMDELSAELGCSKSNVFANLRGLEAAGIVEHRREAGARHDRYRLRGKYPDVVIGAYVARLRRVVSDKRVLVRRAREILGDERTGEAQSLRAKLDALGATYDRFAELFEILPPLDGPLDLKAVLDDLPRGVLDGIVAVLRSALGLAAAVPRSGARRSNSP